MSLLVKEVRYDRILRGRLFRGMVVFLRDLCGLFFVNDIFRYLFMFLKKFGCLKVWCVFLGFFLVVILVKVFRCEMRFEMFL